MRLESSAAAGTPLFFKLSTWSFDKAMRGEMTRVRPLRHCAKTGQRLSRPAQAAGTDEGGNLEDETLATARWHDAECVLTLDDEPLNDLYVKTVPSAHARTSASVSLSRQPHV